MQNILKFRTSTRKRTRIVDEDDRVIHGVTLTNVRRTQEAIDGRMDFTLIVEANGGDCPTVSVMLYFNVGPGFSDDVCEIVEMDDCLPSETIACSAVSADLITTLMEENSFVATLGLILANLAAPDTKLTVTAKNKGIHFALSIGAFETEATVSADRVERFIVPKPVRAV